MRYNSPWTEKPRLRPMLPDGRGGDPSRIGQKDQGAAQADRPESGATCPRGWCGSVLLWRCRTGRAKHNLPSPLSPLPCVGLRHCSVDARHPATSSGCQADAAAMKRRSNFLIFLCSNKDRLTNDIGRTPFHAPPRPMG